MLYALHDVYIISSLFHMWIYECVFATLVECSLIEKSNEFFFRARGLVKTHTSRIITWLVFRLSRLIERMTCSSINLPMHISSFLKVFLFELGFSSSAMTRVWPQAKSSTCVSVDKEYGHATTYMHNHGDHEEHFYSITILCVVLRAIV